MCDRDERGGEESELNPSVQINVPVWPEAQFTSIPVEEGERGRENERERERES